MTKPRQCCYSECGEYRAHWTNPEVKRGTQIVQVPDDLPDDRPVYCSITCAVMAGAMKLRADDEP